MQLRAGALRLSVYELRSLIEFRIHVSIAGSRSTVPANRSNSAPIVAPLSAFHIRAVQNDYYFLTYRLRILIITPLTVPDGGAI
jgi:hypothetical protein